jgi:nucleolar complex protein 3
MAEKVQESKLKVIVVSEEMPIKEEKEKSVKPAKKKNPRIPLAEIKESLANIASSILEDPEKNVAELKNLLKFCSDSRPEVMQLSLLTLLAVFRDIIPGYRIRKLSEEELAAQVSKEVRRLRNFEETLLSHYQAYLQTIEAIIKSIYRFLY